MTELSSAAPAAAPPLFRPQAIDHARGGTQGRIVLVRPVSHWILTSAFVLLAIGIVLFFARFSYTRKADVTGVLQPSKGLIRVVPPQAGIISECLVREGQSVQAGDVLIVLTSERASTAGGNAEQTISTLMRFRHDSLEAEQRQLRQQADHRIEAARRRADDMSAEMRGIDAQIALQQRRVDLARTALDRLAGLQAAGFVATVQVQDKQADWLDQQQRLADLRRSWAATARDLSTAQAEASDLRIQASRDLQAGERTIATTDQDLTENEARRRILVRAPESGVVSALVAEPGQAVAANQTLASILPQGSELEADLYAPSRAVGFIKPGMPVLLRYEAYAYQKFGQAKGVVREVSRSALRPVDLDIPVANAVQEPLYRVRVGLVRQSMTLYGVDQPLKPGTLLQGSILLDRRRLYEWVLDPLYALSGKF